MQGDMHKVNATHLKRSAYLYIRQSTPRQVLENAESTKRQYALRQRAIALGWQPDRIVLIDSDLGHSAALAADREGFQRLVSEVGMGRAGLVIGLEVSRLARNSSDWHRLLEICALTDTLILDEDGLYDATNFNDRLLLGLNRPETQSTSYSTFWRTTILGSVAQFWTGARLSPGQAVPAADISNVLTGKTPAKSTAEAGAIQRRRDFCIGAPRSQIVNPGNRFFWRFQRAFSARSPLHALARYRAGAPANLHFNLPHLARPIHLHGFDRHPQ
jgi:hypothetical protein